MKATLNDKVAVLKNHEATDTPYIVMTGTLEAVDRGRATEDKRANAEEGEVTDANTVTAKNWVVVRREDGRLFSFPVKSVKLHTQKIVQKHEDTMAQVARATADSAAKDKQREEVFSRCAAHGLDVDTLSEKNALRILELLGESVHPLAAVAPAAVTSAQPAADASA